jgi:uncharacterized membrane protein YkoI
MTIIRVILVGLSIALTMRVDAVLANVVLNEKPESQSYQSGSVSLDQAVAMVQSRYGARVMRANTVEEEGRLVHYIRLMSADRARVWTVRIDAATGREF